MKSPREILREIVANHLREISLTGGYSNDLSNFVTLEPLRVAEQRDEPLVAVLIEKQTEANDLAVFRTHRATQFAVVVKAPATVHNAQEVIDSLVDDVERAFEKRQGSFPVGYLFPKYIEMMPIPPEAAVGWVGAIIRYTTNIPIRNKEQSL